MRRAHFDFGWMLAEDGTLLGLSLGYDRCAEHGWGIAGLLAEFGVASPEFPQGVQDRTTTQVPERLRLQEFNTQPRDKRRKGYPSAMLSLLGDWEHSENRTVQESIRAHDLAFIGEPHDKFWKPTHDLVASWSKSGFAVQVRGDENIARLKELFTAFQAKDIAIAVPWSKAFFQGGISFVIASRMPEDAKQEVLARDLAHQELQLAAKATGVYEMLESAGKAWIALSPSWFDAQKDEVVFFLNPDDQRKYTHGWFTVAELTEWTQERGPVMRDKQLEEYAKRPENYDWSCRLLRGMNAVGVKPRYHEKLIWLDDAKTIPGLRYRATRDTEVLLPSGNYAFSELMARFATPLKEPAAAA